jgi:hypothetical protein
VHAQHFGCGFHVLTFRRFGFGVGLLWLAFEPREKAHGFWRMGSQRLYTDLVTHPKFGHRSQSNEEARPTHKANPLPFVPKIGSEEGGWPQDAGDDNDEQLLYRVSVFD